LEGGEAGLYFIQVSKALLEQGDPFSSSVSSTKRLRFSIGTFLLVAIVISNAYKSSNVYNLVLPRKPVPYENLSQLLNDSFKIYSKAMLLDTRKHDFGYRITFYENDWKYLQSRNYSLVLRTNVLSAETPFMYTKFHKVNELEYYLYANDSYFSFGPLVSGLNNGLFYISEISQLFINIFGGEKGDMNFFAKTKHSFNYTTGVTKRLLETVELVPGLDSVMADFLKEKFPDEVSVKNFLKADLTKSGFCL